MRIEWILLNSNDDDILLSTEDEESSDYERDEEDKYESGGLQTKKMMMTPFGLAVMDNSLNPFKGMQLWQFHTDFPITKEIHDIIEETPGCEILKITSPYRGCLVIGRLFNSTDFRREVEKRIKQNEIPNEEISVAVNKLKQKLASQSQNWAIYVFPNGYSEYISEAPDGKNKMEVQQLKNIFEESQKHSHGYLFQSGQQ